MPARSLRLPAEWETQSGVMLTWPHDQGDWADTLAEVEPVFMALAGEIARREYLLLVCASDTQAGSVRAALVEAGAAAEHIITALCPSDDTWARDHGPLTVLDRGRPRLLDFRFNGWGGKYPAGQDDAITSCLAGLGVFGSVPVERVELVLEGGSIDSDGAGTLLTTASCLLHPGRNPGLSATQIEQLLQQRLGAQRLLWLQHGALEGDDTDGHIDMLARFCAPDAIVYQACDEPAYRHYDELQAMAQELRAFTTVDDKPYRLHALPWPGPKYDDDGARLPASYANFLLINGAVLVPAYNDPADARAAGVLQACFPGREIVLVPCLPLIRQAGSLHCLSMQFPNGLGFGDNS